MPAAHYLNKVAPVNLHSPRTYEEMSSNGHDLDHQDEFFTFTVGKLDAGMAILIGDRASQIEFPSLLLPSECTTGSVVRISVSRNQKEEQRKKREFDDLQENVLELFGKKGPVAPSLRLRAVTQTSITLEWDKLDLATSKLLKLDIYRNNERLAAIPNPLHNTSTKLSGLQVDQPYTFHLVLKTTAGTFQSNVIRTKTHNMTDTSGISVCFGYIEGSAIDQDGESKESEIETTAKEILDRMGAKYSDKIQIDTTHFVCTSPRSRAEGGGGGNETTSQMKGATYTKAANLSIPIVMPHWIFACAEQKKMVPISQFYLDREPPNAAAVRDSMQRRSTPAATPSTSTFPPTIEEASTSSAQPQTTADGAAVIVPTESTGEDAGSEVPPAPAPKDSPLPTYEETAGTQQVEGVEPAPHPVADDVEGPMTTTIAAPPAETESATQHTSTAMEASLSEDKLDEISLGGGSVRGDGDQTEEIDLS